MGADHETTSKLILQGDPSGLVSTMERAQAQVNRFNGMVDSTSGTLGKFTGMIGVITGVLAGGAMFKAAADETLKWTGEAVKLSRQLGITTEQASVLNLAAGDVYVSMDTVSLAANALTKNSLKSSDAFEHYGVSLKDANGHQRSTVEIMQDTNEAILQQSEGREREIAGFQLYGKSWDQVRGIIKLTKDGMEEARRKAEELHLVVGPEAVANSKAYKAAMNDVEDILMSLKIQVGNQLLPILTNLGVWFNDIGPTALFLFEGALKGVMTFIHGATLGVNIFWEVWKAVWNQFSSSSIALVKVITQIISGDFSGAWATAKQGWSDFNQYGATAMDNIITKSNATGEQLQRLWGLKAPTEKKSVPEPGDGPDLYDKDASSRLAKILGLEDEKLKSLLQGYQLRIQASREQNALLISEEEFYLKAGIIGQSQYNDVKYNLEREQLANTMELIAGEIREIEAAKGRKLALATDPAEQAKITEQAKQATAAQVAEKQKLVSELYQLDLKYFTDERALLAQADAEERAQNMQFYLEAERLNKQALDNIRNIRSQIGALKAEDSGDSRGAENTRYQAEQARLFDETVLKVEAANQMGMDVSSIYAQHEAQQELSHTQHLLRMSQYDSAYDRSRKNGIRDRLRFEQMAMADQVKYTASSLVAMTNASANSNRTMFMANKAFRLVEAGMELKAGIVKTWNTYPYPWNIPMTALHVATGVMHLNDLASANYGGSGGSPGGNYGGGTPTSPVITQPLQQSQQQSAGLTIMVKVDGNVISEDRWVEERLAPAIRDLATNRNVNFGLVPQGN